MDSEYKSNNLFTHSYNQKMSLYRCPVGDICWFDNQDNGVGYWYFDGDKEMAIQTILDIGHILEQVWESEGVNSIIGERL